MKSFRVNKSNKSFRVQLKGNFLVRTYLLTISSKFGRLCGVCFQQSLIREYMAGGQQVGAANSSPPRTMDITS